MKLLTSACACAILMAACGAALAGEDHSSAAAFFEQTDIYVSGQGGYHTYRIPAIVVSKQGTILAFCEGRKTSPADHGDIDLLLRRSFDGGKTWQETQLVHEEGGTAEITIGNPCPIVDQDGTIHLLFCRDNAQAFYTRSDDDGATFSAPRQIAEAYGGFRASFPWTRLGTGPGHGIQTRAGRLIAPVWLNDRVGQNYRSAVVYSDDLGLTWKAGGIVEPTLRDCNECMAVEQPDGSLLLNMRTKEAKCRAVASSTDGGITWTPPRLVAALVDPICQGSIIRFNAGDRDHQNGILFCNAVSSSRNHLTVKLSNDEANTWPIAKLIDAGPSAYSDLAVTTDGTILCMFENGSKRPYEKLSLARFNLKWLTSVD